MKNKRVVLTTFLILCFIGSSLAFTDLTIGELSPKANKRFPTKPRYSVPDISSSSSLSRSSHPQGSFSITDQVARIGTENAGLDKRNTEADLKLSTLVVPSGGTATITRGNDILISGLLWTGPYDRWSDETVYLYWNINTTEFENILTTLGSNARNYLDTNYLLTSDITNADGQYDFILPTDLNEGNAQSKLGSHDFVVYFWGNPTLGREAGVAGSGTITVIGQMSFSVTMDSPGTISASSTAKYQFTAKLSFDNGTPVLTNVAGITFSETRINLTDPGAVTPVTSDFSVQPIVFSNPIGDQLPPGGKINVSYVLTPNSISNLRTQYPNFNVVNDPSGFILINVTVDVNFQVQLWNGSAYETRSYVVQKRDDYFAANVTITQSQNGSTAGVPDRLITLELIQNSQVKATYQQKTTTTGILIFNVTLPNTLYTQAGYPVFAKFTYENTTDTVQPGYVQTFKIIFNATVTTIQAKIVDSQYFRTLQESVTVVGNVTDEFGRPAKGVTIYAYYDFSISLKSFTTITDANGEFRLTMTFNNLDATGQTQDTLNFWINFDPTPLPLTGSEEVVWSGTSSALNFASLNIVRSIQLQFRTYEFNSTNDLNPIIQIFNSTFADYFNGVTISNFTNLAKVFVIIVKDQAGRAPIGVRVEIFHQGRSIQNVTVDSVNNGLVTYDPTLPATNFDTKILNNGGSASWQTKVYSRIDTSLAQSGITYSLWGPDIYAPVFTTQTPGEAPGLTYLQGQPVPRYNVTITITVDDNAQSKTGIKEVILYYRYALNDTTYSLNIGDYTAATMSTADGITYTYKILFPDGSIFPDGNSHGKWVHYFIVAFDYAGYGYNISSGTRFTTPQYDPNYSNNATLLNNGQPFMYQIGDGSPPQVDLGNDLLINQTRLSVYAGNQQEPGVLNVTIVIVDSGGIQSVQIGIRNRTVVWVEDQALALSAFVNTSNWGEWSNYTMNFAPGLSDPTNGVYAYTILINSTLEYEIEVDFAFTIVDSGGNIVATPTASQTLEAIAPEALNRLPKLVDQTKPVQVPPTSVEYNGTQIPNGYEFGNQTGYLNVTVVFSDDGTGIEPTATYINFIYFYTNDSANPLINASLLMQAWTNGTPLLFEFSIRNTDNLTSYTWSATGIAHLYTSGEFKVTFTIPLLPASFLNTSETWPTNIALIWSVSVQDQAGNKADPVTNTYLVQKYVPPPSRVVLEDETTKGGPNIVIIIVVFLLVLTGVMIFYRWPAIMGYFRKREQLGRITASLRQKLDEIKRLGAEGKYRRAVQLAYRAMEELASKNLYAPRLENQTVREFADYLATLTPVAPSTLRLIAESYEKAKYSNEEITFEDFDNVVKALEVTTQTIAKIGVKAFEE